jgi:hypothetical protein
MQYGKRVVRASTRRVVEDRQRRVKENFMVRDDVLADDGVIVFAS